MRRTSVLHALFLLSAGVASASAQSPPLDNSRGFFAGEWTGQGEQGSFCYVSLKADGSGVVLIDPGAGDWSGASIQWQNRGQSLQIDKRAPLRASPERRIMPLNDFGLRSEFNRSLSLTWTPKGECHLLQVEAIADRLTRAREAVRTLPPSDAAQ
jgi:hypothetical protein